MGGIPGYYQWLDALGYPGHEMHKEAVEWLGEGFDPAQFDLDQTNRRLAAAFESVPKRPRKRATREREPIGPLLRFRPRLRMTLRPFGRLPRQPGGDGALTLSSNPVRPPGAS